MFLLLTLSLTAQASDPAPPPIINGGEATEDDYAMAGGMLMDATLDFGSFGVADVRLFVCSSTLIAPDVVMLAAHCLDDYAFTFGFGDVLNKDVRWTRQADLSDWDGSAILDWPADTVAAQDWVVHDDWDITALQTGLALNYDIALIFLEEALTDVPLSYLPTPEEATQIEEGAEVTVVGWGQQIATGFTEAPPEGSYGLKQMGLSSISELSDHEIKVGELESDVRKCHGDSGGPTFLEIETDSTVSYRQIGVTSHAYDSTDCFETGGVDTRVDFYLDWIDAEMRERCDDGTRAWCDVPGILPAPQEGDSETDTATDGDTGVDDTGATDDGGSDEEDPDSKGCSSVGSSGPMGAVWLLGLFGLVVRRRL